MSTVEEFERDCAYRRQPITLKWKNGLIPSEGVCLVVDQVFHDKCWDKYSAKYNGSERSQARKDNGGRARVIDQVDPIEETQANSRRTMSARNVAFAFAKPSVNGRYLRKLVIEDPGGGRRSWRENQPFVSAMASPSLRPTAFRPRFRRIAFNIGSGELAAYLRWNGAETESLLPCPREKSAN